MKCQQCGISVDMTDCPVSYQVWCSDPCYQAWHAAHPEAAEGWISVADLTPVQRAELDGILGHGAKA